MAFLALQSVPNAASFCLPYKFTQSTKKCKLGIRFDYIFLLQQTRWITRRWSNLGNDELIFLIRERSFQCHPRPWGGKVLQDGRVGRKSGCTFITVFFSIQALQHKLLLWSFHQTFGISNKYYPHHKNMAMYSFVALIVGYVTNTQPYLKPVSSTVSPVSGPQWKQSHRPDASNVFPQWNTQLSLWRSAIKIPRTCHHVYR